MDFWLGFLFCYLIVLGLFGALYGIALWQKSYNYVNIAFGAGFPLAAIMMGIFSGNFFIGKKILTVIFMLLWGARIVVFLYLRKYGKDEQTGEDRLFKMSRDKFGTAATWKGFLYIFLPQTIYVMVVGFPAYVVTFTATSGWIDEEWIYTIGSLFWAAGFVFELIADLQMWKFKADEANKGKIMKSGLWKYSMHPNYFGEIIQWTGIFILGIGTPNPTLQVIGLLGPIAIWAALLFLSGIPLLDARFKDNAEYQEYRRNTNRLVPWFKKSSLSRKD